MSLELSWERRKLRWAVMRGRVQKNTRRGDCPDREERLCDTQWVDPLGLNGGEVKWPGV